jgi:release factor glutamine methyltransferase
MIVEARFYDLPLELMPGRVMTPRSTTERLVERALARLGDGPAVVADVGTGSGAVAVAVAKRAPLAEVWATDVSEDAVQLARRNAWRHGLCARVHVRCGDLLDPVPRGLDLIVANLPYLPDAVRNDPGYAEYEAEPATAIFAPADGLDHYRRLVRAAQWRLAPHGALLIQLHREVLEWERDELRGLELLAA